MRNLLCLSLVMMLSGCASSGVQFYTLDNHLKFEPAASDKPLVLASIKLASYLKNRQLHVLDANNHVSYSSVHLWAEPLEEGLQRILANDLEKLAQRAILRKGEAGDFCALLSLRIEKFSPDTQGNTSLSGRWFYYSNRKLMLTHNFHYQQKLKADGFAAATQSLRTLMTTLAADIAKKIQGQQVC